MKKTFYIICTIFLGLLLSIIAHAIVEMVYIKNLFAQGLIPQPSLSLGSRCFLPAYAQITFLFSGIIGGYLLGQNWWRIVYVEHRHWRYNKKYEKK